MSLTITRVKQATSEFIKVLRYGKSDVRTAEQYLPFGIDSKPVNEKLALYANTGNNGELAIVGYIIKSEATQPGESRIYSTDASGVEQTSIYLTNAGFIEVGGNADNMVRFIPLDSGLQAFKGEVQAELVKIAAAINAIVPASYTPGALSVDISGAKIESIKTL